jgi:hypothetical protein
LANASTDAVCSAGVLGAWAKGWDMVGRAGRRG